jgi:hypothetical protein
LCSVNTKHDDGIGHYTSGINCINQYCPYVLISTNSILLKSMSLSDRKFQSLVNIYVKIMLLVNVCFTTIFPSFSKTRKILLGFQSSVGFFVTIQFHY